MRMKVCVVFGGIKIFVMTLALVFLEFDFYQLLFGILIN